MRPDVIEPLALALEAIMGRDLSGLAVEALWAGDRPEETLKIKPSALAALVRRGGLGTRVRYTIEGAGYKQVQRTKRGQDGASPLITRSTITTISKDADLITFINVFTVDPANQSRLVELLRKATDVSVRHARGLAFSALHRSLNGTKVTMYAQWRSLEDYEAMRNDRGPLPYFQEALTIATFEPGVYEVVESFTPPGNDI